MTDKKATGVTPEQQPTEQQPTGQQADFTADVSEKKKPAGWIKPVIEFGSLISFFIAFRIGGIYAATATFMVVHPLSMLAAKKFLGHIAKVQWFTLVIVMVMGGLTLYLQDETFVKMKLTVINSLFAGILLFGLLTGRLFFKSLMESALEMPDEGWRLITRNYIIFLALMAGVNEVIWRNFSTDTWVNFKTFGYMGALVVFTIAQAPFLAKYLPSED